MFQLQYPIGGLCETVNIKINGCKDKLLNFTYCRKLKYKEIQNNIVKFQNEIKMQGVIK